jgi:hypothetical protein
MGIFCTVFIEPQVQLPIQGEGFTMAHGGYEYDEIDDSPRRLRAHSTPAVETPYTWLAEEDEQDD